jgi:hypothetical protein
LDNQYIINPLSLHAILNFSFFSLHFVSFRFIWFRFVLFDFVSFFSLHFVSLHFASFCYISFRFVSFRLDEISNLYRGPSIDASYQVTVHLAKRFQRCSRKNKQFLLQRWHLSFYSWYKPGDKTWMRKVPEGTCKVRNEMKPNEKKRNETKCNKTKQNVTKRNVKNNYWWIVGDCLWHLPHIRHFYNKSLARNLHVLFIHQNFNSSSPSIERSTLQKVCEFFRWQQFGIYWPDNSHLSIIIKYAKVVILEGLLLLKFWWMKSTCKFLANDLL